MTTPDMAAMLVDAAAVEFYAAEESLAALRLAAFVRSVADETPVDAEWLAKVTPDRYHERAFRVSKRGEFSFVQNIDDAITLPDDLTRGRVRLFALAMGLELREETA